MQAARTSAAVADSSRPASHSVRRERAPSSPAGADDDDEEEEEEEEEAMLEQRRKGGLPPQTRAPRAAKR